MKERITLQDNGLTALMKLSEGNPGAMSVLMEMMTQAADIDPDDIMGSFGALLHLDSMGIYGPRIWMLYKDVCKENLNATLGLMRAVQLGFISRSTLDTAIDNYGQGLDVDAALAKVKDRLPRFVMKKAEA